MSLTISIVTPNLNGAAVLGGTIDSVLAADRGGLEYVVVDGGSTDGSLEVIGARAERLAHWVSEKDCGVYAALNKGFAETRGEVMAWLNAGDYLFPDCLSIVREIFGQFPEVEWLTSRVITLLDANGRVVSQGLHPGYSRRSYLRGENLPGFGPGVNLGFIQQESTFWRRTLWQRAGGRLDESLRLAADFELWTRFFRHARLYAVAAPLGAFRKHEGQLSAQYWDAYLHEAWGVLRREGGKPQGRLGAALRVFARQAVPNRLRGVAHRLGIFEPALVCDYDFKVGAWRLREY